MPLKGTSKKKGTGKKRGAAGRRHKGLSNPIGGLFILVALSVIGPLIILFHTIQAKRLDSRVFLPDNQLSDPPQHRLDEVSFTPELSKRTLSENESTTLDVYFTNNGFEVFQGIVVLENSSFDASTESVKHIIVAPNAVDVRAVTWILTPKKTGTFLIAVTANRERQTCAIVVTDILGFSTRTVKIGSIIAVSITLIIAIIGIVIKLRGPRKAAESNVQQLAGSEYE